MCGHVHKLPVGGLSQPCHSTCCSANSVKPLRVTKRKDVRHEHEPFFIEKSPSLLSHGLALSVDWAGFAGMARSSSGRLSIINLLIVSRKASVALTRTALTLSSSLNTTLRATLASAGCARQHQLTFRLSAAGAPHSSVLWRWRRTAPC